MQLHSSNVLLDKIKELEKYLTKKYSNKESKIFEFLKDLKTIEPNLSILSLINYLVDMHRDGFSLKKIEKDVHKTKKIFQLVDEYVRYIESDEQIRLLFNEIHKVIISRLNKALLIYKQEFDLSFSKNKK